VSLGFIWHPIFDKIVLQGISLVVAVVNNKKESALLQTNTTGKCSSFSTVYSNRLCNKQTIMILVCGLAVKVYGPSSFIKELSRTLTSTSENYM
jgi:hypothetical protein